MNSEPPTGDDLARLLVTMKQNVLERTTESPRRKRHRNLGLGLGLAALLAIGGGSGALALGMLPSPFRASAPATPTGTPTPSPTVTPTATPRPTPTVAPVVAPQPSVPIDCATLASGVRMDLFIPSPELGAPDLVDPTAASLLENGVLTCTWDSSVQSHSDVIVSVSADRDKGLENVDPLRGAGWRSVGVGDSSAMNCSEDGCFASLVAGPWWVQFESTDVDGWKGAVTAETRAANTTASLQLVVDRLDGLVPRPAWTRPASSWSQVDDCSRLAPGVALGEVIGSPRLEGPFPSPLYAPGRMSTEVDQALLCQWMVPSVADSPTTEVGEVYVSLGTGSGWAVDETTSTDSIERSPATVAGADGAEYVCLYGEGSSCSVNVLTDGSWLQVGSGNAHGPDLERVLVAAAEAIVATRPAG
ncbi:hypothetical protein [Frigoribacterium sp. Leaf186]|uniref:hypothetical protein n=1 Tax=Frigoribacterium sp. Leaf186 TaxID=1736293 RepID=UPI0006F58F3D|nr:hypothetical protein [Frigoribacterium sp. Leaf186]KQS17385.1 hypothetical protein ASG05_07790 [Frigoribacterium sp. Leaf186]